MRALRVLGPALFLGGGAALALAVARGEASLSLVLIVPVVVATGALGFLAIVLLAAGFLVTFLAWPLSFVARAGEGSDTSEAPHAPEAAAPTAGGRRWGGVLFLGPIPVVFGSDVRVTRAMLLLGILLFLALLALTLYVLPGWP